MDINREEIKKRYNQATDQTISTLKALSADVWSTKSADEAKNEVELQISQLKNGFKEISLLKKELINLKKNEIDHENQVEQKHLEELEKKWRNYDDALSVVFFGKDSPFIFKWSPTEENWEDGLIGLKAKPPIVSKEFIKIIQNFLETNRKEFNEN